MSTPESILTLYDRVGPAWAQTRDRRLVEKRWLDRMIALAPRGNGRRQVLDLGCGAGRPIAEYIVDRGLDVTGVDGAQSMAALFQRLFPQSQVHHADMRTLSLDRKFDAIIAWDSLFHLSPADQTKTLKVITEHAADDCALLFTSGDEEGVAIGQVEGEPVYHASHAPETYRAILADLGWSVMNYVERDPDCSGHTVWLAKFTGV